MQFIAVVVKLMFMHTEALLHKCVLAKAQVRHARNWESTIAR